MAGLRPTAPSMSCSTRARRSPTCSAINSQPFPRSSFRAVVRSLDPETMPAALHAVYTMLVNAAVWGALVPFTLIDIARGRATWTDLRERLGAAPASRERAGLRVVVHAVSAGEATAAIALIRQVAMLDRAARFIATCGTDDARVVFRAFAGDARSLETIVLLPWDRARALTRWIDVVAPDAVVVVEPEIWPNLYAACRRRGVPLLLANAHIDRKSTRMNSSHLGISYAVLCLQE